jgi:hypothetical protein
VTPAIDQSVPAWSHRQGDRQSKSG